MKHKRVKLSISIAVVILLTGLSRVFIGADKSTTTTTVVPKTICNLRKNVAFIVLFLFTKIFNQVENSVVQVISTIEPGNNSKSVSS